MMIRRNYLLLPLAAAAVAIIALKVLPIPFLWMFLGGTVGLILMLLASQRSNMRALFLNLAVVGLTLSGLETYAYFKTVRNALDRTYSSGYRMRDSDLGAVPVKNVTGRSREMVGSNVVYDVTYSIGSNGLRKAPPVKPGPPKACVVFFGCSFTFGEGLNDTQTMPYRVGALSGGEVQVYNFSFHGWGAHQMLSALEQNRLDAILECEPTHVIYQAIPDHVARAAGIHAYVRNGPRYILLSDGSPERRGRFSDEDVRPGPIRAELAYQLEKSMLYSWLISLERPANHKDVDLWLAIVRRSQQLTAEKFPDAQFHVLIWKWDSQVDIYERMLQVLNPLGLRYHLITDILPGFDRDPSRFLIPYDRHPTAETDDAIARYVVGTILGR